MKKIIYLLFTLSLVISSCVNDAEVRVMPELNCKDTKVKLEKAAGSSFTALISTTEKSVSVQHDADWLSVDVNSKRAIYTALTENNGEDARVAIVKLIAGTYEVSVTVRQESQEPDLSLKIGQSVDEGIGMVFWVDPADKMVGKAVSVQRQGGNPFEKTAAPHQALSAVNGWANSALFTATSEGDAVAYCKALGEGWYLPAREELWELFDVYNGVGHTAEGFVSAVPNSLTEVEKAARAAFDKLLTDLQGNVINAADGSGNGDSYWSSTENEAGDKVHWVRFGKSGTDIGNKTATTRFVRCVRTIGSYTYPEEPATLTVTPVVVTLDGASGATATSELVSNKTAFSVVLTDDSWLSFTLSGTTLTFTSKSKNITNALRSTTATVTAGTGTGAKSVEVTVSQEVAAAGSATLILSSNTAALLPDAVTQSEKITMTSSETEFSVDIKDKSWVIAVVDATNKTIFFSTLSPNLTGADRKTTAIVTAGSGTDVATQEVEITQRALKSNEFAVGQIIADNGSLKGGIVFKVNESDRSKAKIMSLDRASLAWSTAAVPGKTGLTLSNEDGLANTTALAALSNAAEMPAIKFCTDKGAGWYWPTKVDLEEIFETYNGTPLANITADVPDKITEFEKANRRAWDKLLTTAGGKAVNEAGGSETGDTYWASRESTDGTKAFYVRYGKPVSWSSATGGKATPRVIRAIRSISK